MDSNSPIGVFDSGLGGLTVLKELRRLLPHENFIFVGDSARAPYGSRTPEEIISFLQQFMDYFQSRGVKNGSLCLQYYDILWLSFNQRQNTFYFSSYEPSYHSCC